MTDFANVALIAAKGCINTSRLRAALTGLLRANHSADQIAAAKAVLQDTEQTGAVHSVQIINYAPYSQTDVEAPVICIGMKQAELHAAHLVFLAQQWVREHAKLEANNWTDNLHTERVVLEGGRIQQHIMAGRDLMHIVEIQSAAINQGEL